MCVACSDSGIVNGDDGDPAYYCDCSIGDALLEVDQMGGQVLDGDILPPIITDRTGAA